MARGGNRQPVSTENRFQLTDSIGIVHLQRYRFFLTIPHFPAQGFPVFLIFCVTLDATAQTFKHGGSSIMERRKQSKVCLHFTKRHKMLPCVISRHGLATGRTGQCRCYHLMKKVYYNCYRLRRPYNISAYFQAEHSPTPPLNLNFSLFTAYILSTLQ